jgi:ABC-type multidrug transport system ATPase subunit/pSer/pThr/pTyr-binding forkhead associated (FHA) protein
MNPDPNALYLGRTRGDVDIVVEGNGVSGVHCRIGWDVSSQQHLVQDLNSTNGTLVDGLAVPRGGTLPLRAGQVITLGTTARVEVTQGLLQQLATKARGNREQPTVSGRSWVVGRDPDVDIKLDLPFISGRHARITQTSEGFVVEDLGSTNGVSIGSPSARTKRGIARPGEALYLGSYRLPLERLAERASRSQSLALELPTTGRQCFVGRDPGDGGLEVREPNISRRHAEIRRRADGVVEIRDAGSSNGTFVNGSRIRDWVALSSGDLVSLGSVAVQIDVDAHRIRPFADGLAVTVEGVCVDVKPDRGSQLVPPGGQPGTRRIVSDVSFTALPGEFIGLMGPSGAGKTTLLQAINGYARPSAGTVLINGIDLYTHFDAFRHLIGYVPQEDIVYPQLTVRESLRHTARLRLPPDTSPQEIDRRIDDVLKRLEISGTADTIIGDKDRKGISGGQRKRVNLAQELLTSPRLLFLDEPTSGLSSEDTLNVMALLRRLADEGCTIVLTIHQPSLAAYRQLDNLLLLYQGHLAFYGPAHPDAAHFMHPHLSDAAELEELAADPGSVLRPLSVEQKQIRERANNASDEAEGLAAASRKRADTYRTSPLHRSYVIERRATAVTQESGRRAAGGSLFRQLPILIQRTLDLKRKDTTNTAVLLAQAPLVAAAIWLFLSGGSEVAYFRFLETGPRIAFLLVIASLWFGCSNAAREIVAERAIYRRERMVNLSIPAYIGSKLAVLGALCAVQTLVLLTLVWFAFDWSGAGSFGLVYGSLLLVALCGTGIGLVVSALVPSGEAAVSVLPVLLIPMVLSAGSIQGLPDMSPGARAAAGVTPSRWGYEAVLSHLYADDSATRVVDACGRQPNDPVLAVAGSPGSGIDRRPSFGCLRRMVVSFELSEAAGGAAAVCTGAADSALAAGTAAAGALMPGPLAASEPICLAPCVAIDTQSPLSPIEAALGVSSRPESDLLRAARTKRATDCGEALASPFSSRIVADAAEAGTRAMAILAAGFLMLSILVAVLLRWNDPLPDGS